MNEKDISQKLMVFVSVPNHNKLDAMFKPISKVQLLVDKSINLQEIYNLVKNKYPHYINFYCKGLLISKQQ